MGITKVSKSKSDLQPHSRSLAIMQFHRHYMISYCNKNYASALYCFWVIVCYLSKFANFNLPYIDPSNTPIGPSVHWLHWPPQTTAQLVYALPNNYASESPIITMACPKFSPKLPLPLDNHHLHLIHPSLNRPHLPSQTAPGSNQPFCHRLLSGKTDSQTERHTNRLSASSGVIPGMINSCIVMY